MTLHTWDFCTRTTCKCKDESEYKRNYHFHAKIRLHFSKIVSLVKNCLSQNLTFIVAG